MTRNKYHNKKAELDGIAFDSQKEARRYAELKLLERAGKITELELQVPFELIPAQREYVPEGSNKRGKVIERECKYIADFAYFENGFLVVEDVKGVRTPEYVMKRKLMLERHGVRIREV